MTKRGTIVLRGQTIKFAGGLEEKLLKQLDEQLPKGEPIVYEPGTITFPVPAAVGRYKPDVLLKNGIIIEGKGEFTSKERKKFLNVKNAFPLLDVRFVFSNKDRKIGKKSKTTYAMWCERNGFPCVSKLIPQEWIDEPPSIDRIAEAHLALGL